MNSAVLKTHCKTVMLQQCLYGKGEMIDTLLYQMAWRRDLCL